MERLTVDTMISFCDIAQCRETPGGSFCETGYCDQRREYERLREYEQTGLDPEQVEALKLSIMGKAITEIKEFDGLPVERLKELAQADKEGRVVVRPCMVGDTINAFCWTEEKGHHIISDVVTSVITNKFGWTVKTKSKFYPIREKDGYDFAPISDYPYAFADFYVGSREEAEEALAEGRAADG